MPEDYFSKLKKDIKELEIVKNKLKEICNIIAEKNQELKSLLENLVNKQKQAQMNHFGGNYEHRTRA